MKGHIRKRGKRSWAIVLDLGRDADGKRRQKWHAVRGTRNDAERELARLVNEVNTGCYVEPSRMLLGEYLEEWLRSYVNMNVSAKTSERYTEIVRRHLIPALGETPLPKLKPLAIQSYYSEALRNGRLSGKGGLSPLTVLHHHRVLRAALQQAVRWQLLARNPCDSVKPPRPRPKEMQALDEEGVVKLLKATTGTHLYVPILLAVTTGLRRGEIFGLRWGDVNLEVRSLAVRQVIQQTRDGLSFKEPKTVKSRRLVALSNITVEGLRQRRREQVEERLLFGPDYEDYDLVCSSPGGEPSNIGRLSKAFGRVAKASGFPSLRFHDLRHTHATLLLRQGVHPKIVSERLGHSSVGITLDTYSHVLPGMQEEAASLLDSALQGTNRG